MEMTNRERLSRMIMTVGQDDEEFLRAIVSAEDAPSLQKVLNEYGFAFTTEELEEIFSEGVEGLNRLAAADGELSEMQLEEVAGGGFVRGTLRLAGSCVAAFGFGCLCGICPAAYAATPYVAVVLAAWTTAGYMKKGW